LGSYRGKLDIVADILKVASLQSKKTRIMYQANLSSRVLHKYLSEISGASLVCYSNETHCYTLMSKGRAFLEAYMQYSKKK
jgi:predicted transcriptional regulator